MPEILIISGKGGTGKTSLTAAFSHLAEPHVICDLDVDAPDLHLLLQPEKIETHEFWSGHLAEINQDDCTQCGQCVDLCRYDAVFMNGPQPTVNALKCEGCKVCVALCPVAAIDFKPNHCGDWFLSRTRFGPMIHAQLFPAEENSGRLVALLRKEAGTLAKEKGYDLILSDGPPGIGCPVISALSGQDLVVIVTEPTPSGLHDLERTIDLCRHFKIPATAIINKCDLNQKLSDEIHARCNHLKVPVLTRVPHDLAFTRAMVEAKTITEYDATDLKERVKHAWEEICRHAYATERHQSAKAI